MAFAGGVAPGAHGSTVVPPVSTYSLLPSGEKAAVRAMAPGMRTTCGVAPPGDPTKPATSLMMASDPSGPLPGSSATIA